LLEVGFGSGTTAVLLADLGYKVTAVDIDDVLVQRLRDRYTEWIRTGRLEVRQADMLALPWQERNFDLAYHQGVLEHFPTSKLCRRYGNRRTLRSGLSLMCRITVVATGHLAMSGCSPSHWRRLINQAGLEVVDERERDFHRWLYVLPFAFFSHQALKKWPWFGRWFSVNSIFVCRGHK
jgi:SAM-dependent methyltransferase